MSAIVGVYSNSQEMFFFSSCSINSFKTLLLNSVGTPSSSASCLLNIPTNPVIQTTYFPNYLPGQLLSVDQQCKLAMNWAGSTGVACGVRNP